MLGKRAAQGLALRTSDNMAETQKDSYQLGIFSFNLGAINRIPYIAGQHRFPSWARKDIQYRALPYLVFRNVAHIVTLCEAHDAHGGIAAHQQAAAEHGMMGMVVHPEINSQSLAIFVRGDASVGTFIELLAQHQYETENKEDKNKFWIIHGCLFRISFGRNTSGEFVNPRTGVREPMPNVEFNAESLISPHPEPLASSNVSSDQIVEIQGKSDVVECELLPVGSGSVTHSVHRLGLAEIRIAVFHLSSYAWTWAYAETCKRWLNFIACCVNHQIDFITGDGNLFSQRNFKRDDHSDFRTSILMDILERFLIQINLHRNPVNAITYNVVSSTMAAEYIRAMQGESANCDSMILISLCYGKQVGVTEARAKGDAPPDDNVPTAGFDDEVTLADVEHLKHLLNYDLGLRDSDCDWHSPLMVMANLRVFKNLRIRNPESERRRRQNWNRLNDIYKERRNDRTEERREGRDAMPPLRKDSHRHVGENRSRSASRVPSSFLSAKRPPAPPPAPEATSSSTDTDNPKPKIIVKAPPISIKKYQEMQQKSGTRIEYRPSKIKAPPPLPPPRPERPIGSETSARPMTGSTPPWREHESRGRERSRTEDRSHFGGDYRRNASAEHRPHYQASWRNTRSSASSYTTRDIPEPPPPVRPQPPSPPNRPPTGYQSSASQWLAQREEEQASSSTGRRTHGYYQPPYYRWAQQQNTVEYAQGYYAPYERWRQQHDGTWIDLCPQTPDESIFFHQPSRIRRANELHLYGYTFTMGL